MPDPTKTIKDWPPPIAVDRGLTPAEQEQSKAPTKPEMSPVVAIVLAAARDRLGQRETGKNQGAIVREVCAPFLSPERLMAAYDAGKLAWCAAFTCFCWRQGWPKMPRALISLEVDTLWDNLEAVGWTRRWVPSDLMAVAAPKPGDVFFKSRRGAPGKAVHCGLVAHVGAKTMVTIEGNATDGESSGEVRQVHYALTDPRIFGFATIVPGPVAVR